MKITLNNMNILIFGFVCLGVLGPAPIVDCDILNLGKWLGIEKTSADENYWLVKEAFLSAGSTYNRRSSFDHNMNDAVNLYFIPKMEPNKYVAETIWYDPKGEEFQKIRTTYDLQSESKKGDVRPMSGSTRVHSMPTGKLYEHKPGQWEVALYIDKKLVRKLTFSLR